MGKFKLDENMPTEATNLLRDAGHDAVSVVDQQLVLIGERRITSAFRPLGNN